MHSLCTIKLRAESTRDRETHSGFSQVSSFNVIISGEFLRMVCGPLLNVAGLVVKLSSQVLKALQPVFVCGGEFPSRLAHYIMLSAI